MSLFGLSTTEFITVSGLIGSIPFILMKFHYVFPKLEESLQELKNAVNRLSNHKIRIAQLEKQNKTIFRSIGGKRRE